MVTDMEREIAFLKDGEIVTTSLAIANDFGKSHKNLLKKIDEIGRLKNEPANPKMQNFFAANFIEGIYQDEKNR
jgi:phage regulator Rha-like protein